MNILDRYIVRAILGPVALVMTVALVLGALFLFIGQQDDIGVGTFTAVDAFWFVLLSLPQQAWELLPIISLIGALIGMGSLARGSEITVIRATGISVARLTFSALLAAILLIIVGIALGEFVAPRLEQVARQQKAFSKFEDVSFGTGGGSWVRDGNLILGVSHQTGERQFGGMLVFELSEDHRLMAIGHAANATAAPNRTWVLTGYGESRFEPETGTSCALQPSRCATRVMTRPEKRRVLESAVSAGFLGLAVTDPRQLETRALWRLIQYYQANSLDARPYLFAFWSRIARTVAIAFAVVLAVPFALGSLRSAGAGARTMVGLMLGIVFFLLQRLIESGTLVFELDPELLAWLPTTLLAVVTIALLARASRA
jgi:lipopolysaccharide export system permease protein